jgi:hypothetical protein
VRIGLGNDHSGRDESHDNRSNDTYQHDLRAYEERIRTTVLPDRVPLPGVASCGLNHRDRRIKSSQFTFAQNPTFRSNPPSSLSW